MSACVFKKDGKPCGRPSLLMYCGQHRGEDAPGAPPDERNMLAMGGYAPHVVLSPTKSKAPTEVGWPSRVWSKEEILAHPGNFGLRNDRVVFFDVDLRDPSRASLAEAARAIIQGHLGTPAVDRTREGSPSIALGYLLAEGETAKGKLDVRYRLPGGPVGDEEAHPPGFEVRGAGHQTMVAGIHPSGALVTSRIAGLGQATPHSAAAFERTLALLRQSFAGLEGVKEVACTREKWPDAKAEAKAKAEMVAAVANGAGAGRDWSSYVEKQLAKMETLIEAGAGRHDSMHKAVHQLGGMAAAGLQGLSEKDIVGRAIFAMVLAGRDEQEARAEVHRSWESGLKSPFVPGAGVHPPEPPPPEQPAPIQRKVKPLPPVRAPVRQAQAIAAAPRMREPGDDEEDPVPHTAEQESPGANYFRSRRGVFTAEDLEHPPREALLWGPYLARRKLTGLHGPLSVGKSTLAMQLVIARAVGLTTLLGQPLTPGVSVFLSAEDDLNDFKRKVAAVIQVFNEAGLLPDGLSPKQARDKVVENVLFLDCAGELTHLIADDGTGRPYLSERFLELLAYLEEDAKRLGADLVVLETTSRLVLTESNNTVAMLINGAERLVRSLPGAAGIISQHDTKAAQAAKESSALSGRTGTFGANCRCLITVTSMDEAEAKEVAKRWEQKYGLSIGPEEILLFRHTKPFSSVPKARDVHLIRNYSEWGGVLLLPEQLSDSPSLTDAARVRASHSEHDGAMRAASAIRKLCEACVEIGEDKRFTAYALRGCGIDQRNVPRIFLEAKKAGYVTTTPPDGEKPSGGTDYWLTQTGRDFAHGNGVSERAHRSVRDFAAGVSGDAE